MTATPNSIAPFLDMMRQQLLGEGCTPSNIAFAECLDREKLDFSVDSLQVIDQYLNGVHDHEQDVFGLPLLTTIWATSMYIGEIIRREIPAKNFEWVTIGEELSAGGETTMGCPDIGSIRALRSREGEMVMPSRVVFRVILRGRKVQSIHSFAQGVVGLHDIGGKPGRKPHLKD